MHLCQRHFQFVVTFFQIFDATMVKKKKVKTELKDNFCLSLLDLKKDIIKSLRPSLRLILTNNIELSLH